MNPATLLLILQGIEAVLAVAPGAVDFIAKSKALIDSLFTAKLISKAEQDALKARIDSAAVLFATGIIPDYLKVEPDPVGIPATVLPPTNPA